jgi:TonB family protein
MDTVVEPHPKTEPELHLLTAWGTEGGSTRRREAAIGSVAAHVALVIVLLLLPKEVFEPPRQPEVARRQVTPLVAPPFELTQPNPTKGKITKSINLESLLPRPAVQQPRSTPSTTRPAAKTAGKQPAPFVAPPTPAPAPAPTPTPQIAEPPKIETAVNAGAPAKGPIGTPQAPPAPPPQIQPEEKPKLAFETPGSSTSSPNQGMGKLNVPSASVTEAIRGMAQGPSGGIMVGDEGSGLGGLGPGMNLPPSPGKMGSTLQLKSDPQGVDFRPYLVKVLAAVRRNWFAIYPESAKLGSRGRVTLEFSIDRSGGIPKLRISSPSGVQALDRAAVAAMSASTPLPSLPTEFRGDRIILQMVFAYNMPTN